MKDPRDIATSQAETHSNVGVSINSSQQLDASKYQEASGSVQRSMFGETNDASIQKLARGHTSYESEMARSSGELFESFGTFRGMFCDATDFFQSTIAPQVEV